MPHKKLQTLNLIKQLIAIPSVSSVLPDLDMSNMPVIELLASCLEDEGFDVEILPLPGQPQKANLIATKGSGPGGLVLSGHTDTVPYDSALWQYDPFTINEDKNRLYGLGTSDMKSFFALAIEAAREFDTQQLNAPLIILATADEESSMNGAKALVEAAKLKARYAVIGEPTNLKPIRMHKGVMMEGIHVKGQSGHSSNPKLGHNAMEGMHLIIAELLKFRDELQAKYNNPYFDVPVPTINLGHIHGGDNPNRICGHCSLSIDIRPLPGMALTELRGLLRQRLSSVLDHSALAIEFETLFDGIPAMETDVNAELVQVAEKLTGQKAESVAFGTEAPYLQQLGMQTLVMGPGNIDQAHQPDEFLSLDQIKPAISLLKQLIQRFCVGD